MSHHMGVYLIKHHPYPPIYQPPEGVYLLIISGQGSEYYAKDCIKKI